MAALIGMALSEQDIFLDRIAKSVKETAAANALDFIQTVADNEDQVLIDQVREQIAKGVSATVTVTVSKRSVVAVARAARAATIPLIHFTWEPDHSLPGGRIAFVG